MPRPKPRPKSVGIALNNTAYDFRFDDTLTVGQKAYYDSFCKQYLLDFSGFKACIRLGMAETYAKKKASEFLRIPYVACRIQQACRELTPSDLVTRGQVMAALWKEANCENNEGGTRVVALSHIAKMLGMTQPEQGTVAKGGVMVVPVIEVDSWEVSAEQSQKKLKEDVAE